MNVISVPKTIDNDIGFTDYSFGFHTAVGVITDAIDRLRTTAEAHDRVIILEVMGRHSGWLATYAGIAGGADLILVPERPFDIEEVVEVLKARFARGRNFANVVVAEGAKPRASRTTSREARRWMSSGTCSSAASANTSPRKSETGCAWIRAPSSSGTSSAAAPRALRQGAGDAPGRPGERTRARGNLGRDGGAAGA